MPVVVKCSGCGHKLVDHGYTITEPIGFHHDFLHSILEAHNGRCPNCGKRLVLPKHRENPTDYVEVQPYLPTTSEVFTAHRRK